MCNKITKISSQNKYQWIGICEHGVAHIYWRSVNIGIPVLEFEVLMNKALAKRLPVERLGDEYVFWLNRIAIRLTEKDYLQIQDLFALASEDQKVLLEIYSGKYRDEGLLLH